MLSVFIHKKIYYTKINPIFLWNKNLDQSPTDCFYILNFDSFHDLKIILRFI